MKSKQLRYRRSFVFFYSLCAFVILIFILLFVALNSRLRFSFLDFLFIEESLSVTSSITYTEGRQVFYTIKNKKKELIQPGTPIQRTMTLQTGEHSYLGFYIKDHGHYLLYPNSTLFIGKIENYQIETMIKESHFNLERGILYMNINFLSTDSRLILETPNTLAIINEGSIYIDKRNDFKTTLYCDGGSLYFRPYSTKFELFKEKKTYVITSSIERLINSSNMLQKGEYAVIKYNMQKKLDNLLNQIYESSHTRLINKEYITNSLQIPKSKIESKTLADFTMPPLYNQFRPQSATGFLRLSNSDSTARIRLDTTWLPDDQPLLFQLSTGQHLVSQVKTFTTVQYMVNIEEKSIKTLSVPEINGIHALSINGIKQFYLPVTIKNNRFVNTQVIRIPELDSPVETCQIKTDLQPIQLYILLKATRLPLNGLTYSGKTISVDNKNYRVFLINSLVNETLSTITFKDPYNQDEMLIMCQYAEEYTHKL